MYHEQTKTCQCLSGTASSDRTEHALPTVSGDTGSCGIPIKQQREQPCPYPTPDSIAGQVSIGPTLTNPANIHAIAGNTRRALQLHLTARQQSQH
ncbi:hypothetical protein KVH22_09340 [Streptomyces olivaceus]|uniref:hypothetical protein n=1 Tax=Streptomyces olivaceus TaxID=47716 RepID=UPI001CCC1EE8|nr:hypothetical protein [Streptomyces olivaceus]MBZ6255758.1 hypothetical protein [Streptomyces olivaceus]